MSCYVVSTQSCSKDPWKETTWSLLCPYANPLHDSYIGLEKLEAHYFQTYLSGFILWLRS